GLTGTIHLPDTEEITQNTTIANPNGDQLTISGNNAFRLFDVESTSSLAASFTIDGNNGLTLSNGAGGDGVKGNEGGAISLSSDTHLSLSNLTVSHNTAAGAGAFGGAIYAESNSTIALTNVDLTDNLASSTGAHGAYGGAIYGEFANALTINGG